MTVLKILSYPIFNLAISNYYRQLVISMWCFSSFEKKKMKIRVKMGKICLKDVFIEFSKISSVILFYFNTKIRIQ